MIPKTLGRLVVAAATVVTVAACAGDPTPMAPVEGMPPAVPLPTLLAGGLATVGCEVTVQAGAVTCGEPGGEAPAGGVLGGSGMWTPTAKLGGQGTYVTLAGTSVSYAAPVWQFSATITNKLSQRLGSTDGSSADANGIRLVLVGAPTVTSGTGSITAANADGTGTYTAPNQSYWQFAGNLSSAATSAAKTIQFNVPASVTTFTFQMIVAAAIPQEASILRWTSSGSFPARAVSASCTSTTNCVAVGNGGMIQVWNGTSWSAQTSGTSQDLTGVHCLSATQCVAVGGNGVILSGDGTSWSTQTSGTTTTLLSVHCLSSSSCLATGLSGLVRSWDGSSWSAVSQTVTSNPLKGVSCASATYCVAVGDGGTIIRWDGTSWASQTSGTTNNLFGVQCFSSSFCAAAGYRELLRWNGSAWLNPSGVTGSTGSEHWADYNAISCASTTMCMAVALSGITVTWDGTKWYRHTTGTGDWFFGSACLAGPYCMAVGNTAYRGTR